MNWKANGKRSPEETSSDVEVYEAMEDNAKVNTRLFTEDKNSYYMKNGFKITIKDHVLKFDKAELA